MIKISRKKSLSLHNAVHHCKLYYFILDFSQLIKAGLLTVRDAGTWWLALPSAASFLQTLTAGRKASQNILKRTKYKEMLESVR